MQAIFRFNSGEEHEIWTMQGSVVIQKRHYLPLGNPDSTGRVPTPATEIDATLSLSKSQARSIASAMMQAAAEL